MRIKLLAKIVAFFLVMTVVSIFVKGFAQVLIAASLITAIIKTAAG